MYCNYLSAAVKVWNSCDVLSKIRRGEEQKMSRKTVWITGAYGSLGTQICSMIDREKYEVLTSDREVDVTDRNAVIDYAKEYQPDVLINCAGIREETGSEEESREMYRVNALGARNQAMACAQVGAKMIQMSTDDVFAGDVSMELTEFDPTIPTTDYGKSKLAGEKFVESLAPDHLIVRSSWVYGLTGRNFLTYILKMAEDTQILSVPNDQISTPTSAISLARFIIKMIDSEERGIYHASCGGSCSRYGFAHAILDYAGITSMQLVPVLTSSKEMKARYTVLRNLMMELEGNYQMPDWRTALKECLAAKQ